MAGSIRNGARQHSRRAHLRDRGARRCLAHRIGALLWNFWHLRGHQQEGRRWYEQILALPAGSRRWTTRIACAGGRDRLGAGSLRRGRAAVRAGAGGGATARRAAFGGAIVDSLANTAYGQGNFDEASRLYLRRSPFTKPRMTGEVWPAATTTWATSASTSIISMTPKPSTAGPRYPPGAGRPARRIGRAREHRHGRPVPGRVRAVRPDLPGRSGRDAGDRRRARHRERHFPTSAWPSSSSVISTRPGRTACRRSRSWSESALSA